MPGGAENRNSSDESDDPDLHFIRILPLRTGPNAQLSARYSLLDLNPWVFTAGLADPNLWTNRTQMTDVGFNWYLNKFVKVYFDWEHAMFAQAVVYRPGARQLTNDLFWFRFPIYF
jgi:phosphate-selective porin OprO/OprP